jgi:molybdopterin-guanine dinucleotide biosynthesis protein A
VDLADRLEHDLMETALRAMREWSGQFRVAEVTFASASLVNINTPAELAACRGPLAQAI